MTRARVLLIARALAAIALAGCDSGSYSGLDDLVFDDDPATPVVHEFYSGFSDPARLVVRDRQLWAFVWARAFAGRSPEPPRPSLDFSREMVIVAAQGGQPSSGYDISIGQVSRENGSLVVDVTSTSPAHECVVLTVITSPVMMVRVPVRESVRFIEHDRTRSCE